MYGVSPFASQLLVSKAAVCDMRHGHLKAVTISDEVLLGGAVVIAENLLVYVAEQMKWLDRNVRAFQSTLEQAPEIFESIGVNLSFNDRSAWSIVLCAKSGFKP